jgi:hypothetical protein
MYRYFGGIENLLFRSEIWDEFEYLNKAPVTFSGGGNPAAMY